MAQNADHKTPKPRLKRLFISMILALKYQVFHCHNPSQMFLVLLNHFESLEDVYSKLDQTLRIKVRNFFINNVAPRFEDISIVKWTKLRRQILNDYQVEKSKKPFKKALGTSRILH